MRHPVRGVRKATWLLPHVQAEITYSSVTADGMLRDGTEGAAV
jgi:hypothetical protein